MKKLTVLLFALALLCAGALAESTVPALTPLQIAPVSDFEPDALYCGPTQGFYRHEDQTLDLTAPFVCFGQYDCWTMAAQGTPEAFGPVGWIEGGLFDDQSMSMLSFDDAFSAMIEEDAAITNAPMNADGAWDAILPRGTQVTVLAAFGDFLYVQTEINGMPARVFVPEKAF